MITLVQYSVPYWHSTVELDVTFGTVGLLTGCMRRLNYSY